MEESEIGSPPAGGRPVYLDTRRADELATRARRWFAVVETRDDPREALALARSLGEPVLVTGSLYLLADLEGAS